MDFRKNFRIGDRTLTNNGEYVEVFEIHPDSVECAVLDFETGEVCSEDVRIVTFEDLQFNGSYSGVKSYIGVKKNGRS